MGNTHLKQFIETKKKDNTSLFNFLATSSPAELLQIRKYLRQNWQFLDVKSSSESKHFFEQHNVYVEDKHHQDDVEDEEKGNKYYYGRLVEFFPRNVIEKLSTASFFEDAQDKFQLEDSIRFNELQKRKIVLLYQTYTGLSKDIEKDNVDFYNRLNALFEKNSLSQSNLIKLQTAINLVINLFKSNLQNTDESLLKIIILLEESLKEVKPGILWSETKLDLILEGGFEQVSNLLTELIPKSTNHEIQSRGLNILFKLSLARGALSGILSVFLLAQHHKIQINLIEDIVNLSNQNLQGINAVDFIEDSKTQINILPSQYNIQFKELQHSTAASSDKYVFLHINKVGFMKIGTGCNGSLLGRVYAFNEVQTEQNGQILYHEGHLYFRGETTEPLIELSTETLQQLAEQPKIDDKLNRIYSQGQETLYSVTNPQTNETYNQIRKSKKSLIFSSGQYIGIMGLTLGDNSRVARNNTEDDEDQQEEYQIVIDYFNPHNEFTYVYTRSLQFINKEQQTEFEALLNNEEYTEIFYDDNTLVVPSNKGDETSRDLFLFKLGADQVYNQLEKSKISIKPNIYTHLSFDSKNQKLIEVTREEADDNAKISTYDFSISTQSSTNSTQLQNIKNQINLFKQSLDTNNQEKNKNIVKNDILTTLLGQTNKSINVKEQQQSQQTQGILPLNNQMILCLTLIYENAQQAFNLYRVNRLKQIDDNTLRKLIRYPFSIQVHPTTFNFIEKLMEQSVQEILENSKTSNENIQILTPLFGLLKYNLIGANEINKETNNETTFYSQNLSTYIQKVAQRVTASTDPLCDDLVINSGFSLEISSLLTYHIKLLYPQKSDLLNFILQNLKNQATNVEDNQLLIASISYFTLDKHVKDLVQYLQSNNDQIDNLIQLIQQLLELDIRFFKKHIEDQNTEFLVHSRLYDDSSVFLGLLQKEILIQIVEQVIQKNNNKKETNKDNLLLIFNKFNQLLFEYGGKAYQLIQPRLRTIISEVKQKYDEQELTKEQALQKLAEQWKQLLIQFDEILLFNKLINLQINVLTVLSSELYISLVSVQPLLKFYGEISKIEKDINLAAISYVADSPIKLQPFYTLSQNKVESPTPLDGSLDLEDKVEIKGAKKLHVKFDENSTLCDENGKPQGSLTFYTSTGQKLTRQISLDVKVPATLVLLRDGLTFPLNTISFKLKTKSGDYKIKGYKFVVYGEIPPDETILQFQSFSRTISWVLGKCSAKLVNGEDFVLQDKDKDNTYDILMQTKLLSGGLERFSLSQTKDPLVFELKTLLRDFNIDINSQFFVQSNQLSPIANQKYEVIRKITGELQDQKFENLLQFLQKRIVKEHFWANLGGFLAFQVVRVTLAVILKHSRRIDDFVRASEYYDELSKEKEVEQIPEELKWLYRKFTAASKMRTWYIGKIKELDEIKDKKKQQQLQDTEDSGTKILDQVLQKAEFLLELLPQSSDQKETKDSKKTVLLKKQATILDGQGSSNEWKERLSKFKQMRVLGNQQLKSIDEISKETELSLNSSILICLQSSLPMKKLRKLVEGNCLRGLSRVVGLDALYQLLQLTSNQTLVFDTVGWIFTGLKGKENKLYHYSDNLQACNSQIKNAVANYFKDLMVLVVRNFQSYQNEESALLFLDLFKWRYGGNDHKFLTEINIFEMLHQSMNQHIAQAWGRSPKPDQYLDDTYYFGRSRVSKNKSKISKKILEVLELVIILCLDKIKQHNYRNQEQNETTVQSIESQNQKGLLLSLERHTSLLDEASVDILLKQAFKVIFNELEIATQLYTETQGINSKQFEKYLEYKIRFERYHKYEISKLKKQKQIDIDFSDEIDQKFSESSQGSFKIFSSGESASSEHEDKDGGNEENNEKGEGEEEQKDQEGGQQEIKIDPKTLTPQELQQIEEELNHIPNDPDFPDMKSVMRESLIEAAIARKKRAYEEQLVIAASIEEQKKQEENALQQNEEVPQQQQQEQQQQQDNIEKSELIPETTQIQQNKIQEKNIEKFIKNFDQVYDIQFLKRLLHLALQLMAHNIESLQMTVWNPHHITTLLSLMIKTPLPVRLLIVKLLNFMTEHVPHDVFSEAVHLLCKSPQIELCKSFQENVASISFDELFPAFLLDFIHDIRKNDQTITKTQNDYTFTISLMQFFKNMSQIASWKQYISGLASRIILQGDLPHLKSICLEIFSGSQLSQLYGQQIEIQQQQIQGGIRQGYVVGFTNDGLQKPKEINLDNKSGDQEIVAAKHRLDRGNNTRFSTLNQSSMNNPVVVDFKGADLVDINSLTSVYLDTESRRFCQPYTDTHSLQGLDDQVINRFVQDALQVIQNNELFYSRDNNTQIKPNVLLQQLHLFRLIQNYAKASPQKLLEIILVNNSNFLKDIPSVLHNRLSQLNPLTDITRVLEENLARIIQHSLHEGNILTDIPKITIKISQSNIILGHTSNTHSRLSVPTLWVYNTIIRDQFKLRVIYAKSLDIVEQYEFSKELIVCVPELIIDSDTLITISKYAGVITQGLDRGIVGGVLENQQKTILQQICLINVSSNVFNKIQEFQYKKNLVENTDLEKPINNIVLKYGGFTDLLEKDLYFYKVNKALSLIIKYGEDYSNWQQNMLDKQKEKEEEEHKKKQEEEEAAKQQKEENQAQEEQKQEEQQQEEQKQEESKQQTEVEQQQTETNQAEDTNNVVNTQDVEAQGTQVQEVEQQAEQPIQEQQQESDQNINQENVEQQQIIEQQQQQQQDQGENVEQVVQEEQKVEEQQQQQEQVDQEVKEKGNEEQEQQEEPEQKEEDKPPQKPDIQEYSIPLKTLESVNIEQFQEGPNQCYQIKSAGEQETVINKLRNDIYDSLTEVYCLSDQKQMSSEFNEIIQKLMTLYLGNIVLYLIQDTNENVLQQITQDSSVIDNYLKVIKLLLDLEFINKVIQENNQTYSVLIDILKSIQVYMNRLPDQIEVYQTQFSDNLVFKYIETANKFRTRQREIHFIMQQQKQYQKLKILPILQNDYNIEVIKDLYSLQLALLKDNEAEQINVLLSENGLINCLTYIFLNSDVTKYLGEFCLSELNRLNGRINQKKLNVNIDMQSMKNTLTKINEIYKAEQSVKNNLTRRACILVEIVQKLLKLKESSLKIQKSSDIILKDSDIGQDIATLGIVVDAKNIFKSAYNLQNLYELESILVDAWISSKPEELKKEIKNIQSPHPYYNGATSQKVILPHAYEADLIFNDDSTINKEEFLATSTDEKCKDNLKKISMPLKKKTESCSVANSAFYIHLGCKGNEFYGFGSMSSGQLGPFTDGQYTTDPIVIESISSNSIVDVRGGHYHTVILQKDGAVITSGDNYQNGFESSTKKFQQIQMPEKIRLISAGRDFTMCVSETNKFYGFGSNSDGRLGMGDADSNWRVQEIPFTPPRQVIKLSSGYNHTWAMLEDGSIWGAGYNYYGQLGVMDGESKVSPVKKFTKLSYLIGLKAIDIACGEDFSIAILQDRAGKKQLYSCGSYDDGRNGQGEQNNAVSKLTLIASCSSITDFKQVASSYNHSVAITENGKVYGWGYGWYGATGSPEGTTHRSPTKVNWFDENNKLALKVSCGYYRTAILTKDKRTTKEEFYVMGSTDDKRIGLPYGDGYCRIPQKPPVFDGKKIKGFSFTWYTSFLWTLPEVDPSARDMQPYKCVLSGEEPINGPLLVDIFQDQATYSEKAANDIVNKDKISPILLFVYYNYSKEKVYWPVYQQEQIKDYVVSGQELGEDQEFKGYCCQQCKETPRIYIYINAHKTSVVLCDNCVRVTHEGSQSMIPSLYYRYSQYPVKDNLLKTLERTEYFEKTNQYGFGVQVIPKYNEEGYQYLLNKYKESFNEFSSQMKIFTPDMDKELAEVLSKVGKAKGVQVDSLDAKEPFTKTDIQTYGSIANTPIDLLIKRISILTKVNKSIQDIQKFIDFSQDQSEHRLLKLFEKVSPLMFPERKEEIINQIINSYSNNPRREFKVNRLLAQINSQEGKVDNQGKFTIFGQIYREASKYPYNELCLSGPGSRAFSVKFLGEGSIDAGGPYREVFVNFCTELQSSTLPLLIQTPNQRNNTGLFREKWTVNPKSKLDCHSRLFEFFGVILGIVIRSKDYLPLDLPSIFWKQLANQTADISDLEAIDKFTIQCLDDILNIEKKNIDASTFSDVIDQKFVTFLSDGSEVELLPNGKDIQVTFDNRKQFVELVIQKRLQESQRQIQWIRKGLLQLIPEAILGIVSWEDLQTMVCGKTTVDVEFLKKNTTYDNGDENHPTCKMFWKMLKSFSDEERSLYLKFVWGRTRLPLNQNDFNQKHQIALIGSNNDTKLPLSHTCFFKVDIPQYSNVEIMTEKFRFAIKNCAGIDIDNNDFMEVWDNDISEGEEE